MREKQAREAKGQSRSTAPGSPSAKGLLSDEATASFDRFASGLGGRAGLAVGRVGQTGSQPLGDVRTGKAWSTIKLAIAAQVLSEARGPRGLSALQASQMRRAITASDNGAASQLFQGLENRHGGLEGASQAVAEPLRAAGDSTTTVSTHGRGSFSTYGQTDWSLVDQQRFTAKLVGSCVPDAASARYLLGLMGDVVAGQRWGIGSAGVPSRFKGGWGPDTGGGYLVRQTGVLDFDRGRHPVVLTVAAVPSDGQFASGQRMLTQLSQWVVEHVDHAAAGPVRC